MRDSDLVTDRREIAARGYFPFGARQRAARMTVAEGAERAVRHRSRTAPYQVLELKPWMSPLRCGALSLDGYRQVSQRLRLVCFEAFAQRRTA